MTIQHSPAVQIHLDRAQQALDRAKADPVQCAGHMANAIAELESAMQARRQDLREQHGDDGLVSVLRFAGL